MSNASVPLRCKCRRQALTSLRCSRCSIPICPDCSKVAPVGMLCRECANPGWSPLFQVSGSTLGLSIVACLGVASLGGWIMLTSGFGLFGFFLAFLVGLAVAETALRITGRKRGPRMEAMAGICTAVGVLASGYIMGPMAFGVWHLAMAAAATISAVNRVRHI